MQSAIRLAALFPVGYENRVEWHEPMLGPMRFHYAVISFFVLTGFASAQDAVVSDPLAKLPKPSNAVEYAASNERVRFDFMTILNPDCSSLGKLSVRVLTKPAHGDITFLPEDGFSNFKDTNVRSKCNLDKVHGLSVYYQSTDQYVGEDKVTVLFLYPDASADVMDYEIIVR